MFFVKIKTQLNIHFVNVSVHQDPEKLMSIFDIQTNHLINLEAKAVIVKTRTR